MKRYILRCHKVVNARQLTAEHFELDSTKRFPGLTYIGRNQTVHLGDKASANAKLLEGCVGCYIIAHSDGTYEIQTKEDFKRNYEPLNIGA